MIYFEQHFASRMRANQNSHQHFIIRDGRYTPLLADAPLGLLNAGTCQPQITRGSRVMEFPKIINGAETDILLESNYSLIYRF
jgi:hypothetical protein